MERDAMTLSTDVVMDIILSYLKTTDLLACRKVSKFWNKAASSVLRKRSTMIKNISKENQLMQLQRCMDKSWDFPLTGLVIDEPWELSSPGAMEFFRNYGARFTRLRLGTPREAKLEDQAPFINDLPGLSILELGCSSSRLSPELLGSSAGQEDRKILKLSSVRTIRILSSLPEVNEVVLGEVFKAASPMVRIEFLRYSHGILKVLKSAGKLQAVSIMTVELYKDGEEFRLNELFSTELLSTELLSTELPTLTKLDFRTTSFLSLRGLMKLLISSQHTLKELRLVRINPSDFSTESPVLTKLTTLSLYVEQPCECVFKGRNGHKFPALKEFKLNVTYDKYDRSTGKLSDGLFIVPSLTKIQLDGYVDKAGIEDLARVFPNVLEIRVSPLEWSQRGDLTDIWSVGAFKFLEKLTIWKFIVRRPRKTDINMDSFLTAIPVVICENLRKHSYQNLVDSPFNEILRGSPNILQLKNLKELIVCLKPQYSLEELPKEPPFISMVSVWYALQMMPNLQAKFVYEKGLPLLYYEDEEGRDKSVTTVKGAFKHVQPYVDLESFFY